MQDRHDCAVTCRIKKFVGMPARRKRPSFGFAITYYTASQKIGIVENRTLSMRQRIAQFTSFMDRARCFRRIMTVNAPRKRELFEQQSTYFYDLFNNQVYL